MNILVVGNGFDLAHYLPTAYSHFMGVMAAIETMPDDKTEIKFEDLFEKLTKGKEENFFQRCKKIYDHDSAIHFDVEKILALKSRLTNSTWYAYFKKHMEINTWIDFENKISDILDIIFNFYEQFEAAKKENSRINANFFGNRNTEYGRKKVVDFSDYSAELLNYFRVIELGSKREGGFESCSIGHKFSKKNLHIDIIYWDKIIDNIYRDLLIFTDIFSVYLNQVICCLESNKFDKSIFDFKAKRSTEFESGTDKIISFNYTNTLKKFYDFENISFLHGKSDQKIVLGVDDLKNEFLRKNKAYGFVKYHQKLLYSTDYDFICHMKSDDGKNIFEYDLKSGLYNGGFHQTTISSLPLDCSILNIWVWGHSLDVSDQDYIKEFFAFQNGVVFLTVLYFDDSAKFSLLANLLHIIGREKIELWMKKGWLKFEKSPDLYETLVKNQLT